MSQKRSVALSAAAVLSPMFSLLMPIEASARTVQVRFVTHEERAGEIRFLRIDPVFREAFLLEDGETFVGEVSQRGLYSEELAKALPDQILNDVLKRAGRKKTTPGDLAYLVERQKSGQLGSLLTNGSPNMFYMRDRRKWEHAVYLMWDRAEKGWYIVDKIVRLSQFDQLYNDYLVFSALPVEVTESAASKGVLAGGVV